MERGEACCQWQPPAPSPSNILCQLAQYKGEVVGGGGEKSDNKHLDLSMHCEGRIALRIVHA